MQAILSATLVTALFVQDGASSSQVPLDDSDEAKTARLEYTKAKAAEYEIRLQSEDGPELTLIEPVLRFNDDVTGVLDGILFLWTRNGRPEASSSFWMRRVGSEFHEFQSLAAVRLFAKRNGRPTWYPTQPGTTPKPIPEAPPPADTARHRLFQMKALARQFSASVTDRTGQQQLRLLPQPVYRCGSANGGALDGALFSFCKGTNPEAMLLVEALWAENGFEWDYSIARMTCRQIEVRRNGQAVWEVPYLRTARSREDPTEAYFTVVKRAAEQ